MKIVSIGYILLAIGSLLIGSSYVYERNEVITEKNKIEYSLQKEVAYLKKEIEDTYDIVLSIPQISLKKGIYSKSDFRNNIDKNITIHKLSDYPDSENSNLILMAHSGNTNVAYFKDLYKLNSDSLIEVYYQRIKYVYKIDNYYQVIKNGKVEIKRDLDKKTITLITCSQMDKTKQLVYVGYLIDEIKY